jgi:hypothetical protein
MYIKEKTLLAIRAMADIQSLSKLSLKTAMKLFDLKVVPILTYGLTTIWEYLGENNLKTLQSVKATLQEGPQSLTIHPIQTSICTRKRMSPDGRLEA